MDLITSLKLVLSTYRYCKSSMTPKQQEATVREFWRGIHWLQACGVELPPELEKCTRLEKQR